MKILFVCQGNVCRSQMAESIFNELIGSKHSSISVGTEVIRGQDSSREGQMLKDVLYAKDTLAVLKEIGIDASKKVRNQLTAEVLPQVDRVVVMVAPEKTPEYLRKDPEVMYWPVVDPYLQSLEFTRGIRDQIHALVLDLVKQLE